MHTVKFIDYIKVEGQKYVGIITILINDLIFLRYKVAPGKTGGFFPNAPSYKISEYGQDSYIAAFLIESTLLKEEIDRTLKSNINRVMNGEAPSKAASTQQGNQYTLKSSLPADSECPF